MAYVGSGGVIKIPVLKKKAAGVRGGGLSVHCVLPSALQCDSCGHVPRLIVVFVLFSGQRRGGSGEFYCGSEIHVNPAEGLQVLLFIHPPCFLRLCFVLLQLKKVEYGIVLAYLRPSHTQNFLGLQRIRAGYVPFHGERHKLSATENLVLSALEESPTDPRCVCHLYDLWTTRMHTISLLQP